VPQELASFDDMSSKGRGLETESTKEILRPLLQPTGLEFLWNWRFMAIN
jgi:hypothetical protein